MPSGYIKTQSGERIEIVDATARGELESVTSRSFDWLVENYPDYCTMKIFGSQNQPVYSFNFSYDSGIPSGHYFPNRENTGTLRVDCNKKLSEDDKETTQIVFLSISPVPIDYIISNPLNLNSVMQQWNFGIKYAENSTNIETHVTTTSSGNIATKVYVDELVSTKQEAITDLETIRAGAGLGATAVQTETDPTVPDWAKAETKPTYTATEVGAIPDTASRVFAITEDMCTVEKTETKGTSPWSSSYYYTDITINPDSGVKWIPGSVYTFVVDTKLVVVSSYRNVRLRIGEEDSWHPILSYSSGTTSVAGSSYFVKAQNVLWVYKETLYTGGALHLLYDANTNTYQRTYRTATNVDLPICAQSVGSTTSSWTEPTTGSYKDMYGVVPNDTTKRHTMNPATGVMIHNGDVVFNGSVSGVGIKNAINSDYALIETINITETCSYVTTEHDFSDYKELYIEAVIQPAESGTTADGSHVKIKVRPGLKSSTTPWSMNAVAIAYNPNSTENTVFGALHFKYEGGLGAVLCDYAVHSGNSNSITALMIEENSNYAISFANAMDATGTTITSAANHESSELGRIGVCMADGFGYLSIGSYMDNLTAGSMIRIYAR